MKILKSPSRYIQGAGALKELPSLLDSFGEKVLFIVSFSGEKRVRPIIEQELIDIGLWYRFEYLTGECSQQAIDALIDVVREEKIDLIVGVGGGKIIDAAKAVSYFTEKNVVIVPTIASSDAACSALSILYHENGVFDRYLHLKKIRC